MLREDPTVPLAADVDGRTQVASAVWIAAHESKSVRRCLADVIPKVDEVIVERCDRGWLAIGL
jgi:hypothetical protein